MKHLFFVIFVTTLFIFGLTPQPALASGGQLYTVQVGDTLASIASHHGVTVGELVAANGMSWYDWIRAGQQLVIPPVKSAPTWSDQSTQAVQSGFGALQQPVLSATAGGLAAPPPLPGNQPEQVHQRGWVTTDPLTGQFVDPLPAASPAQSFPAINPNQNPAQTAAFPPAPQPKKWIDVNLSTQTMTAYEGETPVFTALVSAGRQQYPTVVGTFEIYVKFEKARMRGGTGAEAYDLPDVPYVMYFHGDYGLHGTYWHNNFGTPMSHGCVNLSIPDSEWLFNWASVGTKVVTHY